MLYLLYESSLGFSLFKATSWDQSSTATPKLQRDIAAFQSFKKLVSLEASQLFQGHNVAYETLAALKAGELPAELSDFLKANLSPASKKSGFQLAVQDKTLASKINEQLKVKCVSGETFNELFRGIRAHFAAFLSSEDGRFIRACNSGKDLRR